MGNTISQYYIAKAQIDIWNDIDSKRNQDNIDKPLAYPPKDNPKDILQIQTTQTISPTAKQS